MAFLKNSICRWMATVGVASQGGVGLTVSASNSNRPPPHDDPPFNRPSRQAAAAAVMTLLRSPRGGPTAAMDEAKQFGQEFPLRLAQTSEI
jgi:hypothetical protein